MSPKALVLLLRAAQFIFALLVFVLGGIIPVAKIGNVPADLVPGFYVFNVPASAKFNIFVGLFAMLSLVYIVFGSRYFAMDVSPHRLILPALEFLNWVFSLAGFASLAGAFNLGDSLIPISCRDVSDANSVFDGYHYSKRSVSFIYERDLYDSIIDYRNALLMACRTHDAGIAFGVLSWILWSVTLLLTLFALGFFPSKQLETPQVHASEIETEMKHVSGAPQPNIGV